MKDDFDLDPDFDTPVDFDDELAAFEDFEVENDEVKLRTAILQKENMVALLCIKSASGGAAICRVDPREHLPSVQLYDDPTAAHHWFSRSLRTSRSNGWNVVYDGLPLQG